METIREVSDKASKCVDIINELLSELATIPEPKDKKLYDLISDEVCKYSAESGNLNRIKKLYRTVDEGAILNEIDSILEDLTQLSVFNFDMFGLVQKMISEGKRNFYYNNPASSYYKQLITRENLFNEADTIMAFYPYIMKVTDYPHESDYTQAQSFRDVAVMRLAETYLLRAEAYLGMGRKDLAAADINELRKRAHAETMCTEAEVSIDYILDERTRELLTEEFRMLTLCRLGKLYERVVKYNDFKAGKTISEHNNLWAIPQNEIDANTDVKIENNPGY